MPVDTDVSVDNIVQGITLTLNYLQNLSLIKNLLLFFIWPKSNYALYKFNYFIDEFACLIAYFVHVQINIFPASINIFENSFPVKKYLCYINKYANKESRYVVCL